MTSAGERRWQGRSEDRSATARFGTRMSLDHGAGTDSLELEGGARPVAGRTLSPQTPDRKTVRVVRLQRPSLASALVRRDVRFRFRQAPVVAATQWR
jgi:hypothetical protein